MSSVLLASVLLASGSRYRKALLDEAGIRCVAWPADIDERAEDHLLAELGPSGLALRLAGLKAAAVVGRLRADPALWPAELPVSSPVLAADQLGWMPGDESPGVKSPGDSPPGEQLHKPGTTEAAVRQILRSSGRVVELVNGIVLVGLDGTRVEFVDIHRLRVREITPELAQRYVESTQPLDCVGGIRIEDCEPLGPWPMLDVLTSSGPDGIAGLPIPKLSQALTVFGELR